MHFFNYILTRAARKKNPRKTTKATRGSLYGIHPLMLIINSSTEGYLNKNGIVLPFFKTLPTILSPLSATHHVPQHHLRQENDSGSDPRSCLLSL